jgi:phage baseplate assembly protein W
MGDFSHNFGSDFDLNASGDLLYVTGDAEAQQHIIKRLLTAAGAYIWRLDYGAGLGQFVGQPANATAIVNVIRSQIFQEATVAQVPEPVVTINVNPNDTVGVTINYYDAVSGAASVLSFSLGS